MGEFDEDSDGKDTQILPAVERVPADLEGTIEMDRVALMARIESDLGTTGGKTEPMERVSSDTTPRATLEAAVIERTTNYSIPDDVIRQLRDGNGPPTLDVTMEPLQAIRADALRQLRFEASVDADGKVQLPTESLSSFPPGSRVLVVVIHPNEG